MEKTLFYCAIDVSKEKLDINGAALALPEQLGNERAGYRQLIKAARKHPCAVHYVFEATGPYHLGLALALWEANIPLSILNPARVRYFAKAQGKAKTDPLDKQVIADFARTFQPTATPAPDPVLRELSDLLQRREGLIGSRSAEQTRLKQSRHPIIKAQIDGSITHLAQQIKQLDRLVNKLVNSCPELRLKVEQLCQLKGVGTLTAVTLLVTLPELGTVGRNRIARLAGLAPLNDDSGLQKNKRFIQGGRKRPRCALYMAALSASRHNPILRDFYQRLLKTGKLKKVALTAVMRKLLIRLNALLRKLSQQSSSKAVLNQPPNA